LICLKCMFCLNFKFCSLFEPILILICHRLECGSSIPIFYAHSTRKALSNAPQITGIRETIGHPMLILMDFSHFLSQFQFHFVIDSNVAVAFGYFTHTLHAKHSRKRHRSLGFVRQFGHPMLILMHFSYFLSQFQFHLVIDSNVAVAFGYFTHTLHAKHSRNRHRSLGFVRQFGHPMLILMHFSHFLSQFQFHFVIDSNVAVAFGYFTHTLHAKHSRMRHRSVGCESPLRAPEATRMHFSHFLANFRRKL
jgi:hypothetical protein